MITRDTVNLKIRQSNIQYKEYAVYLQLNQECLHFNFNFPFSFLPLPLCEERAEGRLEGNRVEKTKNLNEQKQQPKDRVSLTQKYFYAHRYLYQRLQVRQAEAPCFPRPTIFPHSQHFSEAPLPLLVLFPMTTLPPFAVCYSSSSRRCFLVRHVLILTFTASPMFSQDQLSGPIASTITNHVFGNDSPNLQLWPWYHS